jgi:hypothetical protein
MLVEVLFFFLKGKKKNVTNDYREKEKEREKHSQNNSLDSDQRYMLARGTMLYIVHKQTNWKRTTNTHTHTHT